MPDNLLLDSFLRIATAAGALGVAAFGVTEGLKRWRLVGEAGFSAIRSTLGEAIFSTLENAYGSDTEDLLRALYKSEEGELRRVIRQGVRIGATSDDACCLARTVGMDKAELLKALNAPKPTQDQLDVIGRFELAVDARIDAAMALAKDRYVLSTRRTAALVAVVVAVLVNALLVASPNGDQAQDGPNGTLEQWLLTIIVGLLAVPVAPIAKDLATAVRAAADALRVRS